MMLVELLNQASERGEASCIQQVDVFHLQNNRMFILT